MKRIVLSLIAIAAFGATSVQSSTNETSKIAAVFKNYEVQKTLAAAATMAIGAGASLFKHPSSEFLKSFGIMGLLQLIPEVLRAMTLSKWASRFSSIDLDAGIGNLSMILPLYNLQAALRSFMGDNPNFTTCGNHIRSALRNMIAIYATIGCKQVGKAIFEFAKA